MPRSAAPPAANSVAAIRPESIFNDLATKQLAGGGDTNDGKLALLVSLVDNTGTEYTASGGGGGGGAATVADAADVAQGATADAAVQGDTAGTLSAKLRGMNKAFGTNADAATVASILGYLNYLKANTPAVGQALAAASTPVVLTAIQQAALTPPAAITGFATEAGHLATIDTSTARIPAAGQKAMAASLPITIASDQTAVPSATKDGSGNGITSTGNALDVNVKTGVTAPTTYVDAGTAVPHATGTALVYFDGSNVPRQVTPTQGLPVSSLASADATPSGQPVSLSSGGTTVLYATTTGAAVGGAVTALPGFGESTLWLDLRGTFTALTTVNFEATVDGTNWFAFPLVRADQVSGVPAISAVGTGPQVFKSSTAGIAGFRVRPTFNGAETVIATMRLSPGVASTGAALPVSLASYIAGEDLVNNRMNVAVVNMDQEGQKATYRASSTSLAAASGDVWTITGSATKTVRVRKVVVSGAATAAGVVDLVLAKRSTADTSGTSTAPTKVPVDSASAASTVTVAAYTVAPTLGTLVGNIAARKVVVPALTSSTVGAAPVEFHLGQEGEQTCVLHGVAEQLCLNIPAVPAGGVFDVEVSWTEE